MMIWRKKLNDDPLPWLLEADEVNPGVRYFALRDLLERPADDGEVTAAQQALMQSGPVPTILDAIYPAGYWVKPGGGYSPKYRSTVWQIIFLAELGANPADERVRRGCDYLLDHSLASSGAFAAGVKPAPSGAIHCLNGNLLAALLQLGYADDPRVQGALDWLRRSITGQEPMRYYKRGTCGPGFACGINEGQPCGWGAAKALKALLAVSPERRTLLIRQAIDAGCQFLLSRDPAVADYPYTGKVSATWFKFGFPLTYWSDVLEVVSILADAGHGHDPRLANALDFIFDKQDGQGRWKMQKALTGKMWVAIEKQGKPSKWITLRALRVLKRVG